MNLRSTLKIRLLAKRSMVLAISMVAALAAWGPASTQVQLPEIGDPSGGLMSPTDEQRLGKAFMRYIRRTQKVVDEPEMTDYLQYLGNKLAVQSGPGAQSFTFFLIDDPTVNAFAGPGGYIGIHSGLILSTQSESELAAVVAHEIAHVTQKHLMRAFDAASRMNLPAAALLLAAIALGTASGEAAQAAIASVQAGAAQLQINFTRSNEQEADRVGIQILADAGFDPRSMPVFFDRMGQATRLYNTEMPEFLRTHPVSSERMADAHGRADAYPYRQYTDDLRYHLVRAKLRVLNIEEPRDAVKQFSQNLDDGRYRNREAEQYGYALALTRAREFDGARAQLGALLAQDPDRIAYQIASAELDRAAGNNARALDTLKTALIYTPGNHALTIYYAVSLIDADEPRKALTALEGHLRSIPDRPEVYKLMARAAGNAGMVSEGYQYLAEAYYLSGNTKAAVEQMERALKEEKQNLYRIEELNARLHLFKTELSEEEKKDGRS